IGRRLGLPIVGVALPGHFLVRYLSFGEMLCIDPFYRGRLWTQADCMRRIRATIPRATPEQIADLLQPTTNAAIVQRLLRNLKHSYLARSDFVRAIAAVERLLLFAPNDPEEIRDRGLLRSRLNYAHYAVEDFERYAALAPTARDLPEIQRYAQLLTARLARGN
ncbi:MAG: tetratricopeptide repeat protein, partial [Chloroflexaceae bacterium]|nr:tetratricopeptide repeat protein [Chloroflexaceae bacterium]